MFRVTRMGKTATESEHTPLESEAEARALYDDLGDIPKQLCVEKAGGGWRRIAGWVRTGGGPAHAACVDNANEAFECGIDRGSCGHQACALGRL